MAKRTTRKPKGKLPRLPKKPRPPKQHYKVCDGVTQSILGDFVACRQRARLMLEGWETPTTKEALVFGGLFHWLLEQYYAAIREGYEAIDFESFAEQWRSERLPSIGGAQGVQDAEVHLARAEALMAEYPTYWASDLQRDWIGIESQFDVMWEGFRLRGMRDGLFRNKGKRPTLWLLENKTTSAISEGTLTDKLAFDFQNLFYLITTEAEIDQRIAGVLYNVIRRPTLKQGDQTLPLFLNRMREDVADKADTYFARFEVRYTEERKREFRKQLLQKLCDFRQWWEHLTVPSEAAPEANYWPTYRNEQACVGRWSCEFLPACASDSTAGYARTRKPFRELA